VIVVNGTMTCAPGEEEALAEAARIVVAATKANEPDCLGYDCARNISDPSLFVFVEKWPDGAALRNHVGTDHYQAFNEVTKRVVQSQVVELHTVEKTRTL
jgi:quinol monooxygenase YgiN